MEEERFYRVYETRGGEEVPFRVKVETTDLYIRAERDLSREARALAIEARRVIAGHGEERPDFLTSFSPLDTHGFSLHPLLEKMYHAAAKAGVGPMAAVAGAVAQYVGEGLKPHTGFVAVENGGDIFLDLRRLALVGIYAGKSPFSGKMAIEIAPEEMSVAVCTSSATVGPSISLGNSDAATIIAKDGALADAAASCLGNRVHEGRDIEPALENVLKIDGVLGALVIIGDRMGCMGNIKLVKV